jgi:hypothetical protein
MWWTRESSSRQTWWHLERRHDARKRACGARRCSVSMAMVFPPSECVRERAERLSECRWRGILDGVDGLTDGANTDIRSPNGAWVLTLVGHDVARSSRWEFHCQLIELLRRWLSSKLAIVDKIGELNEIYNFVNWSKCQIGLNENMQSSKLPSSKLSHAGNLENVLSVQTTSKIDLWAIFMRWP